jgi:putative ribosome biogenesis GTPase RsgA
MIQILVFSENSQISELPRNKCDLVQERKVSRKEAIALAEKNNLVYMETSAKTRINIDEMFQMLSYRVLLTHVPRTVRQKKKNDNCAIQ